MAIKHPITERFLKKLQARICKSPEPDGCWIWTGTLNGNPASHSYGYGIYFFPGWKSGTPRKRGMVHRLMYQLYVGPLADDEKCLHRCDNPSCVKPDHLWKGTPLDNARDRDAKGRNNSLRGEQHPCAIVTTAQVLALRAASKDELPALIKAFKITPRNAMAIRHYENWRHI